MAEASRTGGMVTREAVLERIAARAAPIPPMGRPAPATGPAAPPPVPGTVASGLVIDEVDFSAVDRAGRAAGVPVLAFVARAAVDAGRDVPALASVLGDERLADHRLRALAERIAAGDVPLIAGGASAVTSRLDPGRVAALAVGDVRMRPVAVAMPGEPWGVGVHPVGMVSLAYDTRAVSDTDAAGFVGRVRHILEHRDWEAEL